MKGFWIWGCGVRSEKLKQFLDNLEAEDPLGVGLYGEHYVGGSQEELQQAHIHTSGHQTLTNGPTLYISRKSNNV